MSVCIHTRRALAFIPTLPRLSTSRTTSKMSSSNKPRTASKPRQPSKRTTPTPTSLPSVASLRENYSETPLLENALPASPHALFHTWLENAISTHQHEPNAMCLSTTTREGRPAARMVLLKKYDEGGFVWYTNYESDKARQLERAPFAALTFWWAGLERSVRIEGYVKRCGEEESDEYFYSRPAESRLGAWASEQSRPCEGREMMEGRWRRLREEHLEEKEDGEMKTDIRRPQHWGGYRLIPDKIEFWKGRSARLHDRICYTRGIDIVDGDVREQHGWKWTRLQP